MRAPLSWLRDYAPLAADVADLADALSNLGLVVDGVERLGDGLEGIVVAEVLGIRPHPNADRIRLVDVDAGDGNTLQIVCGAWNFAVGDLVPFAPAGTVLPGGLEISRQKMRGEWSNGMLCSAPELGMPEAAGDGRGLLILPPDLAPSGAPLVEALQLPEVVFDLDISPNRLDALCMAGIARDLAAALGEPWTEPEPAPTVAVDPAVGVAPILVESGDLCPRFTGTILEGVPAGPSPAWLARRLTLAGMRPISAVVDVSNYVMLDLGQPNHAYDLDRLAGGGLLIRRGIPGEELVTLDGVARRLEPGDCVICDATGTPVGVGGIMGGTESEIGPSTRRVLLEAAWFLPMAIARTGVRLGLHSEARVRFERGVDPQVAEAAVERFVTLLDSIGGESAPRLRRGPTVDRVDPRLPKGDSIRLRTDRANAILGVQLDDAQVERLLEPIGFHAAATGTGVHTVQVPSWRLDVEREIDLIEEVGRMWGYRRIERTIPPGAPGGAGGLTERQRDIRRIREALVGAGYDEAWTTTFLAPGDLERAGLDPSAVEVENPLDRSESILRTEMLPGLLKAIKFNVDRQAKDVCLFEIGHVFGLPQGEAITPEETERLGVIMAPEPDAGSSDADRTSAPAKAAVRTWEYLAGALRLQPSTLSSVEIPGWHPTRAARVLGAAGEPVATVGEVDPEVVRAYGLHQRIGYLSVDVDALLAQPRQPLIAREVSRYPASDVDLAFLTAESVPAASVRATLNEAGGELLEDVWLFDVYRGEQVGAGRRSLAFRLRFRALDHTLEDSELAAARQGAIAAVAQAHGAELRT
jgi:phenylalanyl-tRNA synthetase beta chain